MSKELPNQTEAHETQTTQRPVSGLLQRKCDCGQHTVAGSECEGCGEKRLQRRATNQAETTEVPPIVHEVLHSPGQPLDAQTRAFMEPRFGHDFSHVRLHTDARAAGSAQAVNALAYTVGRDIVLGAGQYAPGTMEGRKLLAHELTHIVQQRKGVSAPPQFAGAATILRNASYEREADAQSALVTEGKLANSRLQTVEPLGAGMASAKTIQLQEKSTTSSAQKGGGENTAQEGELNGVDGQGKPCKRDYLLDRGGKVTWEGIDQETLDKNVRLVPEEGEVKVLQRATANSTDNCDAVYFGAALKRSIIKVPDHCTITFKGSFSNMTMCCNKFGIGLAALRGKATSPRFGTAAEFFVPNDWEPSKPTDTGGTKKTKEPEIKQLETPSKGIAKPIKG